MIDAHHHCWKVARGDYGWMTDAVDHLSKPDMAGGQMEPWAHEMRRVAAIPNIFCKISGMPTEAGNDWSADCIHPSLRAAARAFGADRLIFGTDWPVCTLAASYAEIVDMSRSLLGEIFASEDLEKIFATNACRFYRLT